MTNSERRQSSGEPPGPPESHEPGATDESIGLMSRWFRQYGDTYRVQAPGRAAWRWVVHHPDDVKRVLVGNHRNYTKGAGIDRVRLLLGNGIMTSEGEFWRRQRRMIQPCFSRGNVEQFADLIRRLSDATVDRWEAAARRDEAVNVTQAMRELTLEVVLHAIFSQDLGRLVTSLQDNRCMMVARQARRDPKFAFEFRQLGGHVLELVRSRRAQGLRRDDLMQMLMETRDPDTGQVMSEREITDEALTLVVAGHETTASTLNWAWWLIALHPEVEARLHEEHDRIGVLRPAGFGDLGRVPYTLQVLQECMRLYPPGWLLTRRAVGPDRLGGYDVPPGTDVLVSPYFVHRHPQFWDNAERFDPDRFGAARTAGRPRYAYIPFAAGPRHCVGENFAMFEMMLHLNGALRRVRLKPTETGAVAMEARINLRAARDLHMRVEIR